MKDSEFIELLNLYLDCEISAADAARLEAEVQSNPARRRIYQDYCRMQKACKLLATDFQAETAASAEDDGKVLAFDAVAAKRRSRSNNFYTVGAFAAAAACVAIIFVGRTRQAEADAATMASVQTIAMEAHPSSLAAAAAPQSKGEFVAAAPVSAGPRALGRTPQSSLLVADPLLLTGNTQADALMAAARQQADAQFAWMHNVQLAPVQQPQSFTDLRFEARPAALRPENRAINGRSLLQPEGEMSAWQFVK